MAKIDIASMVGKRVMVETKEKRFVGTLDVLREYSLTLRNWFELLDFSDNRITGRGELRKEYYTKYIMHSGAVAELLTCELCDFINDPYTEDKDKDESAS
jgi:hypothetical protein